MEQDDIKRNSMVFYRSFFEALQELPKESQANLYNAIFQYSFNYKDVELSGIDKTVFMLIKPQLEANRIKFENGKKGREHGKKGGAPIGNNNAGKQNNPKTTPKQPQNNPETTRNVNEEWGMGNVNENINTDSVSVSDSFDFKNSLVDYGFNPDYVAEWISIRESKGKNNSNIFYNNFIREIEKSNIDKNEILKTIVANEWLHFNADWFKDEPSPKFKKLTFREQFNDAYSDKRPKYEPY